ncbi:MAG: cbb3-type cytochrome c oxidase subunit 3 [Planctomycetota bacterium]
MIKLAMSGSGLAPLALIGLVAFVAIFAGVIVWTLTRRRSEVDAWSSLPLADGTDPVQPRYEADSSDAEPDANASGDKQCRGGGHSAGHDHSDGGGCGQCANCSNAGAHGGLPVVSEVVTTVSIH